MCILYTEFRKGRGIRDQIANIGWIIKKAREFQKNIYFSFIDYAKAFVGQRSLEGYSPWGGKESDTVSTHAVSRTHSVVLLYVLSLTSKLFAGSEAANFGVLFPSCALGSSQAVSFIVSYTCSLLTSHFAMNWFKLTSLTPNRW